MARGYRDDDEAPNNTHDFPPLTDDEAEVESPDRDLHIETASHASEDGVGSLPLPIWMRESAKGFKYRWVPLPLRKAGRATFNWIKGPDPPQVMRIQPWFPQIQEAPIHLLDGFAPKRRHRIALLVFTYAAWFLTWSLLVWHNSTAGFIEGYGRPSSIWCGASFWSSGNKCGLNGNNCRPFSNANLAFRCLAECSTTKVMDPYHIGNQTINFEGIVIGGPDPEEPDSRPIYRADSFICQAAIHAGVISDSTGGCGVASLIGSHSKFPSSKQHGIESIGFPSAFPLSFTFENLSKSQTTCPKDSRWPIFVVTAITLVLIGLFTTSPAAFFFSTFVILMLHVALVSDPPNDPTFLDLLSKFFGRFLPASFISWIFYRYCSIPLLHNLTAQIEKVVLFLGFAFIGALNNYTFAPLIPIERLTPHDIRTQPGAPVALAIIIILIVSIVVTQIHFLRLSGLLSRYLKLYITMGLGLVILLSLPGLRLRIHHYILAIFFFPGTAIQTRPGLIYQGLLLGLFINGIARWGFDSIIQTPAALGEAGGGHGGSWWGAKSPAILNVTVSPLKNNITFHWDPEPLLLNHPHRNSSSSASSFSVDGISILINDVERWRGYTDEELYEDPDKVTLERRGRGEEGLPEFFRFAWVKGGETGLFGAVVGWWDEAGDWQWGKAEEEKRRKEERERERERENQQQQQ